MTQVKRQDDFGTLTDLVTSARLTDARVTVGGRQYKVAQLDVTYPTLTDGELYFIYITAVAQTPALVVSQTAPVTANKKLWAIVERDSTVQILGQAGSGIKVPKITGWQDVGTTADIFSGSPGTHVYSRKNFRRVGENLEYDIIFDTTVAGSGVSIFTIHNPSLTPNLTTGDFMSIGSLAEPIESDFHLYGLWSSANNGFNIYRGQSGSPFKTAPISYVSWATTGRIACFKFSVQIQEWSGDNAFYTL